MHVVEFAGEYIPEGHMDSLVEVQAYPARQGMQKAAPASEYVPRAHGVQDEDVEVELDPAGHISTPVVVQLEPIGQSVHTDEAAYENVPLLHAVFIPPLHEYPASHAEQLVAASSE